MIGYKILLMFSRRLEDPDYEISKVKYKLENALDNFVSAFGEKFLDDIVDKKILDFGCGSGYQVVAMAKKGAHYVLGVDIREEVFKEGIQIAKAEGVEEKVRFMTEIEEDLVEYFDLIVSHNSFEHYKNPHAILSLWSRIIKPRGRIYITFGPLWYSPYGAHTNFFTKLPWVNLCFHEPTVIKVRNLYRSDGAKRYEEIEGGLNKMTIKKFKEIIGESGLSVKYLKYHAIKNFDLLTLVPLLNELFTNHVDCILMKEK